MLELDTAFGADLALLLHQEKLSDRPSGAHGPLSRTQHVYTLLHDIRPRLKQARVAHYESMLDDVDVPALVDAAQCGKITVGIVCGAARLSTEETCLALMRAWTIVTDIICEVTPRDVTSRAAMCQMNRLAFRGKPAESANGVRVFLSAVLERYSNRYAAYLSGVESSPSTWAEAREYVREQHNDLASARAGVLASAPGELHAELDRLESEIKRVKSATQTLYSKANAAKAAALAAPTDTALAAASSRAQTAAQESKKQQQALVVERQKLAASVA